MAGPLYPLSTADGRAIPLEVIKPASLIYWTLVKNVEKVVTIPAGFEICSVLTTCDCLFRNSAVTFGAPAEATEYSNAILLPSNGIIILNITPGAGKRIYPLSDGVIYLSAIQQWGTIAQQLQTSIG